MRTLLHAQAFQSKTCAQVFLDTFPQLVGTKFGDLVYRFSDGLVLGLLNRRSGACDIAPPADCLVSHHMLPQLYCCSRSCLIQGLLFLPADLRKIALCTTSSKYRFLKGVGHIV